MIVENDPPAVKAGYGPVSRMLGYIWCPTRLSSGNYTHPATH